MRLLRQFELGFRDTDILSVVAGAGDPGAAVGPESFRVVFSKHQGVDLEEKARELLRTNGACRFAMEIRVEWNARLKTCAVGPQKFSRFFFKIDTLVFAE